MLHGKEIVVHQHESCANNRLIEPWANINPLRPRKPIVAALISFASVPKQTTQSTFRE